MHLIAKFHHPTFNRSEVIVLTNKLTNKQINKHKQTPLKASTSLRYATPVGKNVTVKPWLHVQFIACNLLQGAKIIVQLF